MTEMLRIGQVAGDATRHLHLDLADYERAGLRIGIFGASGAGKGWLLGLLLEQFHDMNVPIIAIDPESELWTMQEVGALVLGGPHGDAPIPSSRDGVRAAMQFAIETATPVVFDLGDLEDEGEAAIQREGVRLMGVFNALAGSLRTRVVFAVTEAELFAPQVVARSGEQSKVFASIQKRGRKRGVIPVLETQRTADIAKAVISQCNVRFIGHLDEPLDYDNVKRHVPSHSFTDLRALPTGTFVVTPEDMEVVVSARAVTHGGQTPVGGEVRLARRATSADLAAMIERLREEAPPGAPETAVTPGQRTHSHAAIDPDALRIATERVAVLERDVLAQAEEAAGLAVAVKRANAERDAALADADLLGRVRAVMAALFEREDGTPTIVASPGGLSESDVLRLIRQNAPAGGGVAPALMPVEAIRSRYLEETALRLVERMRALEPDERAALLFLIGQGTFHTVNAVSKAISGSDSGSTRERWAGALRSLVSAGLVVLGGSGRTSRKEAVDQWVRSSLGPHNPTDAEVEQVRNRALAVLMSE